MLSELLPQGPTPLWLLFASAIMTMIGMALGYWRKWKSGEIEDDGILVVRLNDDNKNLRLQLVELNAEIERLRRGKRRSDDAAAIWKRQLMVEGFTPNPVPGESEAGRHES